MVAIPESTTDVELKKAAAAGTPANAWSHKQAYGFAVLCLLLGLPVGYFLRAPVQGPAAPPQVQQAAEEKALPPDHPPLGSVTPEKLKHMANKAAQPLLDKLQQNPSDAKVLLDLGNVYSATRQYDVAITYYEKSAGIKSDAMVLTQLASAYHFSGETEKAIATLDRALEQDPKFANALVNIGLMKLKSRGDKAGAIAAWEKFLKTNPKHPGRKQVQQMLARVRQGEAVAQ